MKYFAHRGLSLKYKDNSIESIKQAICQKYDGVEFDIQLSKDNVLVLFHDLYIKNTFIKDMYYDDLKKLGIISLQFLYEKLDLTGTNLLIDIKGNDLQIIGELEFFFIDKPHKDVIFSSFNRNITLNLPPKFKKGFSFETMFRPCEFEMIFSEFDCIVVHWTCLTNDLVKFCKMNNINIFSYTHKEECEIEYMNKFDIDVIITNGIDV